MAGFCVHGHISQTTGHFIVRYKWHDQYKLEYSMNTYVPHGWTACTAGRSKTQVLRKHVYMYMSTVFPRSVAAATINFSFTEVRRLFEGGVYSARRAGLPPSLAPSTHVNFVLALSALTPARVMADELAQFSFYCYYSRVLSQSLYYTIACRQRDRS